MSKTDNLHDYVQGIVNTVAKKKEYPAGTVINAQDVESEIMSIESGVAPIGKEVTVSFDDAFENGDAVYLYPTFEVESLAIDSATVYRVGNTGMFRINNNTIFCGIVDADSTLRVSVVDDAGVSTVYDFASVNPIHTITKFILLDSNTILLYINIGLNTNYHGHLCVIRFIDNIPELVTLYKLGDTRYSYGVTIATKDNIIYVSNSLPNEVIVYTLELGTNGIVLLSTIVQNVDYTGYGHSNSSSVIIDNLLYINSIQTDSAGGFLVFDIQSTTPIFKASLPMYQSNGSNMTTYKDYVLNTRYVSYVYIVDLIQLRGEDIYVQNLITMPYVLDRLVVNWTLLSPTVQNDILHIPFFCENPFSLDVSSSRYEGFTMLKFDISDLSNVQGLSLNNKEYVDIYPVTTNPYRCNQYYIEEDTIYTGVVYYTMNGVYLHKLKQHFIASKNAIIDAPVYYRESGIVTNFENKKCIMFVSDIETVAIKAYNSSSYTAYLTIPLSVYGLSIMTVTTVTRTATKEYIVNKALPMYTSNVFTLRYADTEEILHKEYIGFNSTNLIYYAI